MASITALRASSQPTATQRVVTGHERPLMSSEALVLENVTRAFGALRAVDDVSFSVLAGEKRAILGANGAGKSTLVRALAGALIPNHGSIRLHARFGFRHAGTLEAIGFKLGRWVDSVLMQRPLGEGSASLPPG